MRPLTHALAELDNQQARAFPQPERLTGLPSLDDLTGGFRPGDFWVVTGAPGQGATTLLTQFACELALHAVAPWAVRLSVPREQPHAVAARLVSLVGEVNRGDVLRGTFSEVAHRHREAAARSALVGAGLLLDAGRSHRLPGAEVLREHAALSGLPLALVVDDADLDGPSAAESLRALTQAGTLVVATLARDAVVDGTGEDADLRSEWARWSDVVLEVRSRGLPSPDDTVPERAESRVRMLRNRRGATRDIPVHFEPGKNRFREPGTWIRRRWIMPS